jgi:lipoyl(octanoyl) transferase
MVADPDEPPYAPATWRLIQSGLLDAADNMAIDEAILEDVADGQSPPTLRIYGWQPPGVSLGHRQPWDVVDLDRCAHFGWDVVRRPTGGRAILHIDELTYSVCAPVGEPRVRGGVLESYQRLSQALLVGLRYMGLSPTQAASSDVAVGSDGPACFDSPSNYEITFLGHKLIGSAQVRRHQAMLQHGTLPLHGDVGRLADALRFDDPRARSRLADRLRQKAATLEMALGRRLSLSEAGAFITRGFAEALNLNLEPDGLTSSEIARARKLRERKYTAMAWQERVERA